MFKFLIVLLFGILSIFSCTEGLQDEIHSSEAPLVNSSVFDKEGVEANSVDDGNEEQFPNIFYIGPNENVSFESPINVNIINHKLARYLATDGIMQTITSNGNLQVIGFITDQNGFIIYEAPEGMITILED